MGSSRVMSRQWKKVEDFIIGRFSFHGGHFVTRGDEQAGRHQRLGTCARFSIHF